MPAKNNLKSFVIPTLFIAASYIILVTYLMNLGLVQDTIFGDHTLHYKVNLLAALLAGLWTAMTGVSLAVLIITSLLTGANIILITQRIKSLKTSGNLHLVVGGSSLLGIVGGGCATCGLPVLSLLGVTGSFTFLPFNGSEISILSLILLSVSLYFLLRNSSKNSCEVKPVYKQVRFFNEK